MPINILYKVFLFTLLSVALVGAVTVITDEKVESPTGDFNTIDMKDSPLTFIDSVNGRVAAIFNGNSTFVSPITQGDIGGVNTSQVTFLGDVSNFDNINSFSRFKETNLNNGSFAASGFTAENDIGFTITFGIGSSNFEIAGQSLPSAPAIQSFAPFNFRFINRLDEGFTWRANTNNDSTNGTSVVDIMDLDENGNLNISGNYTGDLIQLRGFEPKHDCDAESAGTIVYEANGTSGDFFGCAQQNMASFGWKKLN